MISPKRPNRASVRPARRGTKGADFLFFRRLLRSFFLPGRETLSLFAARCALSYIISALAVTHKIFTLPFSCSVPS